MDSEESDSCVGGDLLKLETKDFVWALAVLGVVIIGLCTLFFGGKGNEIVSYVSFAGTITSVILSVVAIVYSFIQSASSATHSQRLSDISSRIEDTVDTLTDSRTKISGAVEALDKTNKAIGESVETLQTLPSRFERVESEVNKVGGDLSVALTRMSGLQGPSDKSDSPSADPVTIVDRLGSTGLAILYLYVCTARDSKLHLVDAIRKVNALIETPTERFDSVMSLGYLLAFWDATGLIENLGHPKAAKLGDSVDKEVEKRLDMSPKPEFVEVISAIKKALVP